MIEKSVKDSQETIKIQEREILKFKANIVNLEEEKVDLEDKVKVLEENAKQNKNVQDLNTENINKEDIIKLKQENSKLMEKLEMMKVDYSTLKEGLTEERKVIEKDMEVLRAEHQRIKRDTEEESNGENDNINKYKDLYLGFLQTSSSNPQCRALLPQFHNFRLLPSHQTCRSLF